MKPGRLFVHCNCIHFVFWGWDYYQVGSVALMLPLLESILTELLLYSAISSLQTRCCEDSSIWYVSIFSFHFETENYTGL